MKYFRQIVFLLLATCIAVGSDYVEFTVVERVRFAVPGDWPVIASKSGPDKTMFAFQIPNSADKGTADSSNLSITSVYLKDTQDKDTFSSKPVSTEPNAKEQKFAEGWRCASFSAKQKSTSTPYVIWDCSRVVADCGVSVRVAWPHLPRNPADYDKEMEKILSDFLASVAPSKSLPEGGVLRRSQ